MVGAVSQITRVTREESDCYLSGEFIGRGFSYRVERSCGHHFNLATLGKPPKIGDDGDCLMCHVMQLEARS